MSTGYFSHPDCKRHDAGAWHPESPARLQAIDDQLIASRIVNLVEHHQAAHASLAMVARNHSASAVARVVDNVPADEEAGCYPIDGDTLLNSYSLDAALAAAGAAVAATDAVITGQLKNAFCAIRPPGHHACARCCRGGRNEGPRKFRRSRRLVRSGPRPSRIGRALRRGPWWWSNRR